MISPTPRECRQHSTGFEDAQHFGPRLGPESDIAAVPRLAHEAGRNPSASRGRLEIDGRFAGPTLLSRCQMVRGIADAGIHTRVWKVAHPLNAIADEDANAHRAWLPNSLRIAANWRLPHASD
jgi:hypothetical protein